MKSERGQANGDSPGLTLNLPDLMTEVEVTGLVRRDAPNRLYWVPDSIHGISAGLVDSVSRKPLGRVKLRFR